jgi:bacterial/archaeal transporter family-2 protein
MIIGLIFALLAGSLLSLQNIFNSKVNENIGSWSTTTVVLGMGFLASMSIGLIFEGVNMFSLQNMKPWYWFSGILGVGVVTCVVQGMRLLGPTYAIAVVLTSQLIFALVWDTFGWLGIDKVPFSFKQVIGVLVIVAGIFVFKFGGKHQSQEAKELDKVAG